MNFAARCVRSGRVYLSCILNFLRELPATGNVVILHQVQLDIKWWKDFFLMYNGVSMMLHNEWSSPVALIALYSCLTLVEGHVQIIL